LETAFFTFLYLCFKIVHVHSLQIFTITTNSLVNTFYYLQVNVLLF